MGAKSVGWNLCLNFDDLVYWNCRWFVLNPSLLLKFAGSSGPQNKLLAWKSAVMIRKKTLTQTHISPNHPFNTVCLGASRGVSTARKVKDQCFWLGCKKQRVLLKLRLGGINGFFSGDLLGKVFPKVHIHYHKDLSTDYLVVVAVVICCWCVEVACWFLLMWNWFLLWSIESYREALVLHFPQCPWDHSHQPYICKRLVHLMLPLDHACKKHLFMSLRMVQSYSIKLISSSWVQLASW